VSSHYAFARVPRADVLAVLDRLDDAVATGAADERFREPLRRLRSACGEAESPERAADREGAVDAVSFAVSAVLRSDPRHPWIAAVSSLTLAASGDRPASLAGAIAKVERAVRDDLEADAYLAWEIAIGGVVGAPPDGQGGGAATDTLFAASAAQARRRMAARYDLPALAALEWPEPVRVPEWDEYAPGPVPAAAYLARGLSLVCDHCGHLVSADGCDGCDGERGMPECSAGKVWCSRWCRAEQADRLVRDRDEIAAARARVAADVRDRWPDAMITETSAEPSPFAGHAYRGSARFLFGTSEDVGTYREGGDLSVAASDLKAWESFAREQVRSEVLASSATPPARAHSGIGVLRASLPLRLDEAAYEATVTYEVRSDFAGVRPRNFDVLERVPVGRLYAEVWVEGGVPESGDGAGARLHGVAFNARDARDAVARFADEVIRRREAAASEAAASEAPMDDEEQPAEEDGACPPSE